MGKTIVAATKSCGKRLESGGAETYDARGGFLRYGIEAVACYSEARRLSVSDISRVTCYVKLRKESDMDLSSRRDLIEQHLVRDHAIYRRRRMLMLDNHASTSKVGFRRPQAGGGALRCSLVAISPALHFGNTYI